MRPRALIVVAVDAERDALGTQCLRAPHLQVIVAGIGRTNAAAATAEALAMAAAGGQPFGEVLSVGIAGVLPGGGCAIGDLVIATECVYSEEGIALPEGSADMEALGFPLGDFRGNRVPVDAALLARFAPLGHTAPIATVATCSGTDAAARSVAARTGAVAEAMEGAAVVHTARRAHLPALEIRAISNTTGERATQHWNIRAALASLAAVGDALARG